MGVQSQSDIANFEQHRKTKGLGPPKSPMSLTAPEIKGVLTDFADAMPSVTVAFQAVFAPEEM